jgi:MFS transporter, DHA1 family, multidrug resistance protein
MNHIRSHSELAQAQVNLRKTVSESLLVPSKATLQDPAVLFTNLYLILIFGICYSFFETFPRVYQDMYGFDLLEQGLAFLPVALGTFAGFGAYVAYLWIHRVSLHQKLLIR